MRNILWPFWLRIAAQFAGTGLGMAAVPLHGYWWILTGLGGCVLGGFAFDGYRSAYAKEKAKRK